MPKFAEYVTFIGLQNARLREKLTATWHLNQTQTIGFNRSNQSDEEHGGLGAPAVLNPPCSLQEQQGVLGIITV